MNKIEMNNITVDNNLIDKVYNTYLEMGGSYFDEENVEYFINEIIDLGIDYNTVDDLIDIVADHMMGEE